MEHPDNALTWWILLGPLAGAALAGILALTRRAPAAAPLLTILGTAAAGAVALSLQPARNAAAAPHADLSWLTIPPAFSITLGVQLDSLAWLMVLVVCVVSLLVQVYSTGYMRGEVGYARYFAYLGLFTASMLGLVVADNLFQLYVCWELVGICSYLLIGFWWHKPSAANAAKKAFVVTRFGDVGFLLGVLLLASAAGSFQFGAAQSMFADIAGGVPGRDYSGFVSNQTLVWLVPLLLFCGAVGKSAQFPLHVWLPDAMEGPTPVSALIHAATMVAAGVYMVARLLPLFAASEAAMATVLVIGAATALIAATIALVQNDIKKVMAYSTVSQLGYMMLGLGAGSMAAGMFHLTTHAMFKALLFLCAGSVIHALHHAADPNDLRGMGGLRRSMPHTAWTCAIGVLALAGFPGFSGFWSKDSILAAALERGSHTPLAYAGLVVGIAVAGLTAFYAARMWLLAFWGEPRSEDAAHAHESPPVMTIPLWVLAVPSLVLGFWLHSGHRLTEFLLGPEHHEAMNWPLAIVTTAVAAAGMGLAAVLYARPRLARDPVERMPGPLYRTFVNLWGVDAFWANVAARGTLAMGGVVAWFDRNVVDGLMNLIGWSFGRAGEGIRRTTTGQAQTYAAVMMAAALAVAALLMLFQTPRPPASVPRGMSIQRPQRSAAVPDFVHVGALPYD